MNLQSTVEQNLPTLNLTKWTLRRWFVKNKGKEKRHVEKPLLTPEHKQARVLFARRLLTMIQQGLPILFLDEKWMYLFSRRKQLKHLPRAPFEEEGIDNLRPRKVISRRHPVKTMFMGIVTAPLDEQNFNGKIGIIRLSKQHRLQQNTYRQRFHDDHDVNQLLKNGDWQQLYNEIITSLNS